MKDMREKLDKYKGRATITAARDGRIEEVICRGINKVLDLILVLSRPCKECLIWGK